MYPHNNIIPNNSNYMYRNNANNIVYEGYGSPTDYPNDDRFLFAPFLGPFVVGGLAGTALGYGIANNNQLNNNNGGNQPCCQGQMIYSPVPPVIYQQSYQQPYPPTYTTNYY